MLKRFFNPLVPNDIQPRLLLLAAVFLFIYSTIFTLAPAVRTRSWIVEYNWSHWLGFLVWCVVFLLLNRQIRRYLPDADPYLLPISSILTGWGVLTIWRLLPNFGLRQAAWILIAGLLAAACVRYGSRLVILRKYKYFFFLVGIVLTALTFIFGTNPAGDGIKLWLGCCGFYLQPSEPLKLLFLIYLSAYLTDLPPQQRRLVPFIGPTVLISSLAVLLILFQRDLGTATIFIFLYVMMLYLSSGRKRLLIFCMIGLILAGIAGYFLYDVVRLRIDAWINPWLDPAGRSFQIVQSLMAVANGGVGGRGPGLGSPGLVPVTISDFIFVAIAEETGLAGSLALFSLFLILIVRGLLAALHASDNFHRLLAAGLTIYLGAQCILIIGGNTRLLPLTGVTLPFVSYGGSSLLTSFVAITIILIISNNSQLKSVLLPRPQPYQVTGVLLSFGFLALSLITGWWGLWRSSDLLSRTDNARRTIADRYVKRGSLLDRNEKPINITVGQSGSYARIYSYPALSAIAGYTSPIYGQAGLEASLDDYLRGLRGNLAIQVWVNHMLYGQPPPGLDIRLTIDLDLQARSDFLLGPHKGAVVILNAQTGEILAMSSHPTFDANQLDEIGPSLLADPDSPMLNRVTQVSYPAEDILEPFLYAFGLTEELSDSSIEYLFTQLGFYSTPDLYLPGAEISSAGEPLYITPIQLVLATSSLSFQGQVPTALLVSALNTPEEGWIILPYSGQAVPALLPESAAQTIEEYTLDGSPFWQFSTVVWLTSQKYTWSIGGTLSDWQGIPIGVVVLLEKDAPNQAGFICKQLLDFVTHP